MMMSTATLTASASHAHMRGLSGGIFDKEAEQEQSSTCQKDYESCTTDSQCCTEDSPCDEGVCRPVVGGTLSCSEGTKCWSDSDCTHSCGPTPLTCDRNSPNDRFGTCTRKVMPFTCLDEGGRCRVDYQCCGSLECEDSTCTRVTNANYCSPKNSRCYPGDDSYCCGTLACINRKCTGTAECKKQGGFCEADYDCCDGLECGASHWCVEDIPSCKKRGTSCDDDVIVPIPCCDGLKCFDSKCVVAGIHRCKLFGDTCRRDSNCCGILVCVAGRCISQPELCFTSGRPCANTGECCLGLNCRSNRCIRVH
jgi:hypothetical protein